MLKHYLDDLLNSSNHILLLQGPIGDFFKKFADWLKKHNKKVYKINFNQGDEYFYPLDAQTFAYRDKFEAFNDFLNDYLKKHQIDSIVCFGDNRPYHKIAKALAKKYNIHFWVFEEGYFRPHYVTLEKDGVNAFSLLPHEASYYLKAAKNLKTPPKPLPLAKGFLPVALRSSIYYIKSHLGEKNYPNYQHHRNISPYYYLNTWLCSGFKKAIHYLPESLFAKKIRQGKLGKFYILPLQVHNDSQVKVHSDFKSIQEFLCYVLESFAQDAPDDLKLIVKHHPMDRGCTNYQKEIKSYLKKYPSLNKRLYYIYDIPLPILLRQGQGMITLNSTSGLSALLHQMPVLTLGRANYHFKGMTDQGDLKSFWQKGCPPQEEVFSSYQLFHLNKTQINGSFYTEVNLPPIPTNPKASPPLQ